MAIQPYYVYKPEESTDTMARTLLGREELAYHNKALGINTAFKLQENRRAEEDLQLRKENSAFDKQVEAIKLDQEFLKLEDTLATSSLNRKQSEINVIGRDIENQTKQLELDDLRGISEAGRAAQAKWSGDIKTDADYAGEMSSKESGLPKSSNIQMFSSETKPNGIAAVALKTGGYIKRGNPVTSKKETPATKSAASKSEDPKSKAAWVPGLLDTPSTPLQRAKAELSTQATEGAQGYTD